MTKSPNTFKVCLSAHDLRHMASAPANDRLGRQGSESAHQQDCVGLARDSNGLRSGSLDFEFTDKAAAEFQSELNWPDEHWEGFLLTLHRACKHNSQWCFSPRGLGPYPCDSYLLGYDRFKNVENARRKPYVYVKFSVIGQVLLIFSAHPERK